MTFDALADRAHESLLVGKSHGAEIVEEGRRHVHLGSARLDRRSCKQGRFPCAPQEALAVHNQP
jgi:hypothetical protein